MYIHIYIYIYIYTHIDNNNIMTMDTIVNIVISPSSARRPRSASRTSEVVLKFVLDESIPLTL